MKFRKVMALALAASMAVSLNAVSVLAEGGDTMVHQQPLAVSVSALV